MTMTVHFSSLLVVLLSAVVRGMDDGALPESCGDMIPKHRGTSAQTTPSPYKITFTPESYTTNGPPINVTIVTEEGAEPFIGYLVMASYVESDLFKVIRPGSFSVPSRGKPLCRDGSGLNRTDHRHPAVTHFFPDELTTLPLQWSPLDTALEDIVFRATFVHNFSTYWVDVRSEPLKYTDSGSPGRHSVVPAMLWIFCLSLCSLLFC